MTKRTIQRDIDALRRVGLPIESRMTNGTVRWRFIESWRAEAPIAFALPELMALYFSRGLLKPLQGTPFYGAIESALAKVGGAIPAQGHVLLQGFDRSLAVSNFGWKDYGKSKAVLDAITKAVHHGFSIRIAHAAAGHKSAVTRRVDPYKLWFANGGLYLVGFDHGKDDVRVFAVDRIRRVEVTKLRFEFLQGFDFDEFQKSAFQVIGGEARLVRIQFSKDQAPYVRERVWHESQKLEEQADGSVILSLQVASMWEVKRWLLGWGKDAEVLAPTSLRDEIKQECKDIASRFISTQTGGSARVFGTEFSSLLSVGRK